MSRTLQTFARTRRRRAGLAYIAILFLLVLLGTMGLAFINRVGIETTATAGRGQSLQAHYLAEAAALHAMWRLLNEPAFPADSTVYEMHSLGAGRYGYKVRRHTDTTFATIAAVGAADRRSSACVWITITYWSAATISSASGVSPICVRTNCSCSTMRTRICAGRSCLNRSRYCRDTAARSLALTLHPCAVVLRTNVSRQTRFQCEPTLPT